MYSSLEVNLFDLCLRTYAFALALKVEALRVEALVLRVEALALGVDALRVEDLALTASLLEG